VQALLDVPYADTRAAELAYALGLTALPALKVVDVAVGDLDLQLRILGSSHQVLVRGALELSETVACLGNGHDGAGAAAARPLPTSSRRELRSSGGALWSYAMVAAVEPLDSSRTEGLAGLIRDLSRAPGGVVGVFPGEPHAFTGLRATGDSGAVQWETWHAYPQAGELVRTRTTVRAHG
jgi:hypothetical protein